jgi:hypothetical protein
MAVCGRGGHQSLVSWFGQWGKRAERRSEPRCPAGRRRQKHAIEYSHRHAVESLRAIEPHEHDVLARLIHFAELGLER